MFPSPSNLLYMQHTGQILNEMAASAEWDVLPRNTDLSVLSPSAVELAAPFKKDLVDPKDGLNGDNLINY